jgi:5-keto 4-deoxyuronate isomerase
MTEQTVITGATQAPTKRTYRRRTFKIYHLDRIFTETTSSVLYDCNNGFVVIAETVQEARELASDSAADEGAGVWLDRRKSTITEIGTAGKDEQKSRIVIRDFHAG